LITLGEIDHSSFSVVQRFLPLAMNDGPRPRRRRPQRWARRPLDFAHPTECYFGPGTRRRARRSLREVESAQSRAVARFDAEPARWIPKTADGLSRQKS